MGLEEGCQKLPTRLRHCTKLWVGITGLKKPTGEPHYCYPYCVQKVPALMAPNADVLKASSRAVPVRWGGLRDESKERLGGRLVH